MSRRPRGQSASAPALYLACVTMLAAGCDDAPPDADAGAPTDAFVPCTYEPPSPLPDAPPEPERYTPRWVFEPWISKDISDRADTLDFVQGFRDRDIPVGVVVIDSPWDVHYTTFTPNPSRYPEFAEMVAQLHADDVRVVMWTTAFVNRTGFDAEIGGDIYRGPAPNYGEGQACGFFVQGGQTYTWWKGTGASVDFFDGAARAWWHAQQDAILDMGIDGWKLDFGDSYLEADAMLETEIGSIPHQRYGEEYYRDFLAYGVARQGREFTTMVRAWDESYDRRGRFHARPEHAPVVWMGDNHRDWSGIVDVLDHTFRSARAGYVVLGSDLGGYLDRDQNSLTRMIPFDLEVFHRWTALGALSPFMQLHGRGNLAPWTVPGTPAEQAETTEHYRYWATLHHELVPFWYSLAQEAYASGGVMVSPVGEEASWADDYRYLLGDHFLVAPIMEAGGIRDVSLPAGDRWYDWWAPAADAIEGGTTLASYDASDRRRIPLFVREGSIVPMEIDSDVTALGTDASESFLTLLIWPGAAGATFRLHELDDSVTTITADGSGASVTISLSPARARVLARVHLSAAPSAVSTEAGALAAHADRAALDASTSGFWYDATEHALWIRVSDASTTLTIAP